MQTQGIRDTQGTTNVRIRDRDPSKASLRGVGSWSSTDSSANFSSTGMKSFARVAIDHLRGEIFSSPNEVSQETVTRES